MLKLSLMEAILLKDEVEEQYRALRSERANSLSVTWKKGENKELIPLDEHEDVRPVFDIIKDMEECNNKLAKIRLAIELANCNTLVDFEYASGRKYTLKEAIIVIKRMREDLDDIKIMSNMKKKSGVFNPLQYSSLDDTRFCFETLTVPNFNVKNMKDYYDLAVKKISKLEASINKANLTSLIEIDI